LQRRETTACRELLLPAFVGSEDTMIHQITVTTKSTAEFIDVTHQIEAVVRESGVTEGICIVFVTHTTAGVTINEDADPDVRRDILMALDRMVPHSGSYAHAEGNSPAHVKASLMGSSVTIPISEGRLVLGTWQGVYFAEFDGPRTRAMTVSIVA